MIVLVNLVKPLLKKGLLNMDKLLYNIKLFVDDKGSVWQSDVIKQFAENDTPSEYNKIFKAIILLINSGELECINTQPQYLLRSSSRCLH